MRKRIGVYLMMIVTTLIPREASAEQLGVTLPAPLASTGTQGGPPNFADTYVTPYVATQAGVIVAWKVELVGGLMDTGLPGVPVGVQLKILRSVPGTTQVKVVAEGTVHDPRPELQSRFVASYPFFQNEDAVVQFSDYLPVEPGDIVGVTFQADPLAMGYFTHLVDSTPNDTRVVLRNVGLGGTIDLADIFTGTLENLAPALQIEVSPLLQILIDIKPGSFPNSINLASAGAVPVAILSSETFNATTVVPETISLAGARVKLVGKSNRSLCAAEDVNADGRLDLVCHVVTAQFIIEVGDSIAVLEAQTTSGQNIRGQDSIRIVP
jgi:hypothetical protein